MPTFCEKNIKTKKYANFEYGAVRRKVNLVDLENSKMLKNEYLVEKVGLDTAENDR